MAPRIVGCCEGGDVPAFTLKPRCHCGWPVGMLNRPPFSGRHEVHGALSTDGHLSRILKGASRVTPEMALRLSKAIGRSPESWLAMQDAYDLSVARQHVNLEAVGKLELATI